MPRSLAETKSLQSELAETKSLLESERDALRAEIERLSQLDSSKVSFENDEFLSVISELRAQLVDRDASLKGLQDDMSAVESDRVRLQSELDALLSVSTSGDMSDRIASLEAERDSLQTELASLTFSHDELEKHMVEQADAYDEILGSIREELADERAELEHELNMQTERVRDLRAEFDREKAIIESDRDSLEEALDALRRDDYRVLKRNTTTARRACTWRLKNLRKSSAQ